MQWSCIELDSCKIMKICIGYLINKIYVKKTALAADFYPFSSLDLKVWAY